MAVSVRMNPLLEMELELAAKRRGITKSQFIIDAVELALRRKNPFELMERLRAQERHAGASLGRGFAGRERPYQTDAARAAIVAKLKAKHGLGRTR